ncbi:MAG: DUF7657 domain-containing protein [Rhodoglobus sp.]
MNEADISAGKTRVARERVPHGAATIRAKYRRWATPSPDGLPPARVLLAFPALLLILGVLLVSLSLNGSSSGAFYGTLYAGEDPALLVGHPQAIRSDEWNVGTVWTIAQVEQGFPDRSETFPGGMDASLPYDLPHAEWSIAFRPHQLGYLFLGADHGTAWRWWLPGLALIAAAYAFVVTLLPRRPITAAMLAVGFFYSPFFQWWYQSSTLWPAAWALATMACILWALKATNLTPRWIWAALVAYLTTVMAMGIYAPFIIPAALVVAFFGVGLVIDKLRRGMRWPTLLMRLVPVGAAALASGAVTGWWLVTKAATVEGFLNTVYPGERLTLTGTGGLLSVARTIGFSFSQALEFGAGFLGINSSEASTFFLVGVFLVPVAIFAIVREAKARRVLPWAVIGIIAVLLVFLAFMVLPGWDPAARLLLLDRSTADRARIGVGIASFALLVATIRHMDDSGLRIGRLPALLVAGLYLASQGALAAAVFVVGGDAKLWGAAPAWWLFAAVTTAAVYLFARHRVSSGSFAFLSVLVASSIFVNPLYVGVFDLRDTEASQSIRGLDNESTWVGIGDPIVTATLIESGVEAYNGTQGAPSLEMWKDIDPDGEYEDQWNRIGTIFWESSKGEPVVSNPSADTILVTFDACSSFTQKNVDFVFTNRELDETCLQKTSTFPSQGEPLTIYRVVSY